MLDALRRHATGWVAKVLFAILVLSFAIWGIGDVFRGPRAGDALAEVAGGEITAREVSNEFESRLRQMQQQFGANLDRRAAVGLGVLNQALDAAVARHLVDAHARDLRLTVADETVAGMIRQNPSFQGSGGFERERFDLFLRGIGMSEADYVAAMRGDLVRDRLVASVTGPAGVPEVLTRNLVEHRLEQRRGKALVVNAGGITVEPPSEEALAAYLAENAKAYEAPEYRSVTLLVLRPEDLLGEIEVGDAELRAEYDSRINLYRTPEQRRLEQLLAPDEATIRQAAERVAAGESFAAIADSMKGAGVERSELGPLARGDLPEALGEATWSLGEGAVGAPVQTPFGWHLVRVTEIVPERTQPFEAVKEEIRRELALEWASSQLPDLATRLDDEIAAGTELTAAADKLGVEALKLDRINRTGHNPAKERLAADRLTGEMLAAIFAAAEGETSLLEQTAEGGYYMYRIDAVEPARERPLAEVRREVTEAWQKAERQKRAHARAEELRQQASSPAALEQLAQANPDTRLVTIDAVVRSDNGQVQGLNEAAVRALFATEPGNVAAEVVDLTAGAAVAATEEVVPAQADEQVVSATESALLSTVRAELLGAYEAALRDRYDVAVNQRAVAQLMEQLAQ
ncbi:MAG TPA: SurA N-terminal domain-containing protein [Geminicoccaceae bacterium]|nr:SurA N-terminal domain-containing protein [Geminicoccaceae bacterium]